MKLQISDTQPIPWLSAQSCGTTLGFVSNVPHFPKPFLNSKTVGITRTNVGFSPPKKQSSCLRIVKPVQMKTISEQPLDLEFDRSSFLRITAFATFAALSTMPLCTDANEGTQFSTYNGPISLGFSFSYPSSWTVTKKVIKTHLSEVIVSSMDEAATTAGLVVDAVKIDAIDKFGTPQTVGQKVVDVEKKKDSVKDASLQSATTVTKDGLTYYVIDYTVDSTRGQKRYIAKATVTGNQLYVFTAQAKVDAFQGETAGVFAKMLDSFNVVKQYS